MKRKLFTISLSVFLSLSLISLASAEEVDVTELQTENSSLEILEESKGIITFTETELTNEGDLQEAVDKLMQTYQKEGLNEITESNNPKGGISTMGAPSLCSSECAKAFRYDSKTATSATYNQALSQVQGYYWNSQKVHWTSIAGSSIVNWKGSGTAQFIQIKQYLTIPGTSITWSWPPSFTGSGSTRVYTGAKRTGTNSHAATFSNGGASSWVYLGRVSLETEGYIRDPRGNDARPSAVATIG